MVTVTIKVTLCIQIRLHPGDSVLGAYSAECTLSEPLWSCCGPWQIAGGSHYPPFFFFVVHLPFYLIFHFIFHHFFKIGFAQVKISSIYAVARETIISNCFAKLEFFARFSALSCMAKIFSSHKFSIKNCCALVFLPMLSRSVTSRFGRTIFNGIPGNHQPDQISRSFPSSFCNSERIIAP